MNVFPTSQEQGFRNCARLKNDDVARSFLLDKKTPDSPVPIDFLFYLLKLTYVSFNRIEENPFEQKSQTETLVN